MDGYALPVFRCEGVTCVGCGSVADRLQIIEFGNPTMQPDAYGVPRSGPIERTFRFLPCGCRWIPGTAVSVDVTFGEFPDWMPEGARVAWNESGRAPITAIAGRLPAPPPGTAGVSIVERDPSCCAPERNGR